MAPGDCAAALANASHTGSAVAAAGDPYAFTISVRVGVEFWIGLVVLWCVFLAWCQLSDTPAGFFARRVRRFEDWIIAFSARFLVEICSDPKVQVSMSKIMASGINLWLSHPKTPGHLAHFWSHAPEHMAAEELGKNAPKMAKNFMDGLVGQLLFRIAEKIDSDTRFLRKLVAMGDVCNCAIMPSAGA